MRCITVFLLFFIVKASMAGAFGKTIHSRANCANNESITWYANNPDTWLVVSFHYRDIDNQAYYHVVNTGWAYTWRQAAVHWGESVDRWPVGRWRVVGYHYSYDYIYDREVYDGVTDVHDCSIYNGWWG